MKYTSKQIEIDKQKAELKQIELKNEKLQAEIDALKTKS